MAFTEENTSRVPSLIEILRTTLLQLEESENAGESAREGEFAGNPALVGLKNSILRAIGEMELKKMA